MNRIYTHAQAGEPNAHLNDHNPADPFVVVGFGADWDFTSKDPHWCRRVAATWTQAAELLERASERHGTQGEPGTGSLTATRDAGKASSPSRAKTGPGQSPA